MWAAIIFLLISLTLSTAILIDYHRKVCRLQNRNEELGHIVNRYEPERQKQAIKPPPALAKKSEPSPEATRGQNKASKTKKAGNKP